MSRPGLFAGVLLLQTIAMPHLACAEKRVALVMGNSAYRHAPELANPRNDAADMAAALKKLGFEVIEGIDLDKTSMDRKIRDFATTLTSVDVGVFFYAGHGLQVGGVNYLVPIDAQLTTTAALDWEMVRLDLVQRTMERETKTNVLFLDACRDNPLARNLARAMGTRSVQIGRGLAAAESGIGTLISYSTQPGNVALDGTGRNSPFAAALLKHVPASTESIADLLVAVRVDVMKQTGGKQVPWEHSALTSKFYFTTPPAPAPGEPARAADKEMSALKDRLARLEAELSRQRTGTRNASEIAALKDALDQRSEELKQREAELERERERNTALLKPDSPGTGTKETPGAEDKGTPSTRRIADFSDWSVFISETASEKRCFVVSQPKTSEPERDAGSNAYAYVTDWPNDGVKNEISVNLGRTLKSGSDVKMTIDRDTFVLFSHNNLAFTRSSDAEIVTAMKKAREMVVEGQYDQGSRIRDTYSLSGLTEALGHLAVQCP